LSWFSNWQEVHEYCETNDGSDIKPLVKLVDDHGAENLKKALHQVVPIESADYVISTAHKAKGLEWNKVLIEDDYNYKVVKGQAQIGAEELRLLYVATTRAKQVLNVHHIQPLIHTLKATQAKKAAKS
jgi:superfamily I DNA/RNA helicase